MPRIRIDEDRLRRRGSEMSSLLLPLRGIERGGPAWERRPFGQSRIKLVARDSDLTPNVDEWRFATFLRDFRAAYQEVWVSVDPVRQRYWCLEKAYLNIYRVNRVTHENDEFVLLHADPEEPDTTAGARYKQCPHLHIKAATEPIPHAHIALAHGYIDVILSSETNLFSSMRLGIELICDEILSLFGDQGQ